MSFADKHNKGQNRFDFRLEGEDIPFKKLSDLEGDDTIYMIRGFFISKAGKFGKHPVAIVSEMKDLKNGFFVDFPKSSLDEIEEILNSEEDCDAINHQHVGFTTHKYDNKYGKDFTGFTFVDL